MVMEQCNLKNSEVTASYFNDDDGNYNDNDLDDRDVGDVYDPDDRDVTYLLLYILY